MNIKVRVGGLCVAIAALSTAAAAPSHAGTFGSVSYLTERDCSSAGPSDTCDGSGPGQVQLANKKSGGAGIAVNSTLTVADGSATAEADFVTGLDLPQLHATSTSTGDVRMNANLLGWQSYVYTGAAPSPLSFAGTLDIDDSSSDGGSGLLPDGAGYTAHVAIWDPSVIAGHTDPLDALEVALEGCGSAGVLASGDIHGGLLGGAQSYSMSTASCGASPYQINPGQEVYVAVALQIPTNRGGFVDASHTFGVGLDPALGSTVINNLQRTLLAGGVPEPSSWAMLLLGLGAAGGLLRRRRAFG